MTGKNKPEDLAGLWDELKKINANILTSEKNITKKINDEVGKLKKHFKQELDNAMRKMYNYVDQEIATVVRRMEELENKPQNKQFDTSTTLVATKVPYEPDEDVKDKAERLVKVGLLSPTVEVVNAMRTPTRNGRPGILKIELKDEQTKIELLRKKSTLKDDVTREFNNVYIRSSKTHAERLEEMNMRLLLNLVPGGNEYRIAGNGRVMKKTDQDGRNAAGAQAEDLNA